MQTDDRKRPRYRKYELIPISMLRAYIFKNTDDYKAINLPQTFVLAVPGGTEHSLMTTTAFTVIHPPAPKGSKGRVLRGVRSQRVVQAGGAEDRCSKCTGKEGQHFEYLERKI